MTPTGVMCTGRSMLERAVKATRSAILKAADRSDANVAAAQDLALNVALFAAAVYLINNYGYKLAV